jgi:hypothetical protein
MKFEFWCLFDEGWFSWKITVGSSSISAMERHLTTNRMNSNEWINSMSRKTAQEAVLNRNMWDYTGTENYVKKELIKYIESPEFMSLHIISQ